MIPLFNSGDPVWIWKTAYTIPVPFADRSPIKWKSPGINQIIAFEDPVYKTRLIKRIAALPGSSIRVTPGALECSLGILPLNPEAYDKLRKTTVIPEGQYLVIGDNRFNSRDSRELGLIHISKIEGRVLFSRQEDRLFKRKI